MLSGGMYGTGIRGAERERVFSSPDRRIRRRVYFYISKDDGTSPVREHGLGVHRYELKLGNLYDPATSPRLVRASGAEFESALLDAGYDGYVNRGLGMAVVLNADVPARYAGVDQHGPRPPSAPEPTRLKKSLLSREFEAAEKVASSFEGARVRNGSLEIEAVDKDAVNAALKEMGLSVQFSRASELRDASARYVRQMSDAPKVPSREMQAKDDTYFTAFMEAIKGAGPMDVAEVKKTPIAAMRMPVVMRVARRGTSMPAFTVGPVVWDGNVAIKVWVEKHADEMKGVTPAKANEIIRDPVAIIESTRPEDAGQNVFYFVSDIRGVDSKGQPGLVTFVVKSGAQAGREGPKVNVVKSAYVRPFKGKDGVEARVRDPKATRYMDRARSATLIEGEAGGPSVQGFGVQTSDARIPDSSDVVGYIGDNWKGAPEDAPMFSRAQVGTPDFSRWFGQSTIVNDDGSPKVMYHGTARDITAFRAKQAGAIFVTDKPRIAEAFSNMSIDWMSRHASEVLTPEQLEQAKEDATRAIKADKMYRRNGTVPAMLVSLTKTDEFHEAARKYMPSNENIMPVYVKAENPFDYEDKAQRDALAARVADEKGYEGPARDGAIAGLTVSLFKGSWDVIERADVQRAIKDLGHDGFYVEEGGAKNLAVYNPTQIKSAIGNTGQYDPDDPDIRHSNPAQTPPSGGVSASGWRDDLNRVQFKPGAIVYQKIGATLDPMLSFLQMKAATPEMRKYIREMKIAIERAQKLTADIATEMFKLSESERALISDIIEGEVAAGVVPPAELVRTAAKLAAAMEAQTNELVRLGMLSDETADRWRGKYLPRFYGPKLHHKGEPWAEAVNRFMRQASPIMGMKGSHLKGRGIFQTIEVGDLAEWEAKGFEQRDPNFDPAESTKTIVWRDFTREEREKMGEIRDAAFRFVMGFNATQKDIALGRVFERIADTVAVKAPQDGYVKVPDTIIDGTGGGSKFTGLRRYGKLAGKYVPRDVFSHLSKYDDAGDYEAFLNAYLKALSMWKEGKTVLNPVSHFNNTVSNVTMAHFAGVSYWDLNKYVGAARDLIKGDPMVEEARNAGVFLGTFSQAELIDSMPEQLRMLAKMQESALQKIGRHSWNALTFWLRKPMGKAYQAEDLFFRYLLYRDAREQGMSPEDAVDHAGQYIFSYDDLPKGARMIRDMPIGIPFFSYTYKALPRLLETALKYPWRWAAPMAFFHALQAAMYGLAAGDDDEDWMTRLRRWALDADRRKKASELRDKEEGQMPEWRKGTSSLFTPKTIRLGTDEASGLPVFIDVSRVLPGGDLFDVNSNTGGVPWLQNFTPSSPLFSAAMAVWGNRDLWFGTDVVNKRLDTLGERIEKEGQFLWHQFTPVISVGNYHWDRWMNAASSVSGKVIPFYPNDYTGTDKSGIDVTPGYAALQTVGIKVTPVDLDRSEKIDEGLRKKDMADLERELATINRKVRENRKSPEQGDTERDRILMKLQRLRDHQTINGDED